MRIPEPGFIDDIIDVACKRKTLALDAENRGVLRGEYVAPIALVQWTPEGGKSIVAVCESKDASSTGMCVVSKYMLHVGYEGGVMMLRSGGEAVLLGIQVMHSRYVGEMVHETGLAFIPVPAGYSIDDFRDCQGNLPKFLQESKAA